MRTFFHGLVRVLKWFVAVIILVEICSFLAITLSNYWIYGQARDGDAVRYDPYAVYVSRKGVRPTVHNPVGTDRQRVDTIWIFGGSTTRGTDNRDDTTIPSLLAQVLNQEEPRLPAVVVNFGEPGFNSLMETKYLQKALIERSTPPTVIIFYDGGNDCAYFAQNRTPDGHHGYRRLRGLVESYHWSLFGLLKPLQAARYASFSHEVYDKMMQGVVSIDADSPELKEFVEVAEKRYDYVNKIAGCFGARFFLFWQPCWWVETGEVSSAVRAKEDIVMGKRFALRHNFKVIYQALAARLQDKPYFVDFRNILVPRTEPAYDRDGLHLYDVGNRMVTRSMGRVLKERLSGTASGGGSSR